MDPQDPAFQEVPSNLPEGTSGLGGERQIKIQLAEIPAPRIPAARPQDSEPQLRRSALTPGLETPPKKPSRFAPIKAWIAQGYFDPAKAFEAEVNWTRFGHAQVFLFFLSIASPFLMLLLFGFMLGIVYTIGAALYSVSTPNSTAEVMAYPIVFVLTRGYWLSYLILPIGMFVMGWIWAAITAWNLSRGEPASIDFKKALGLLAMLSGMLAPFTMFPFLRFVALAVLLWFLAKRLEDMFDIGFWMLIKRGGLVLLGAGFLFGTFERKVESILPSGEELRTNLNNLVRQNRPLEWPTFQGKNSITTNERLLANVSDFDPQIREQAIKKSLAILGSNSDTQEFRFKLAQRMADNGQVEACLFQARYYAAGQGTAVNLPGAVDSIQKFLNANPTNIEATLEKAKYLLMADRRLEAKICLVQVAKTQIKEVPRLSAFIQKENLGQIDQTLAWEIQALYQQGNTSVSTGGYTTYSPAQGTRYVNEYQTKQAVLLKKLYVNERDTTLWFYRALAVEFGRSASAGPEVYGETPTEYQAADLENKIKEGDLVALDIAADRCLLRGDVEGARQNWLAATRVLNNDDRRSNVALYLKLARSYDPNDANKYADVKEAVKYYLATLLITKWNGRMDPIGMGPLERLQPGKIPDPMGQPYLDLCLKHDIPEAWVMMGDRYLNGDFPGISLNLIKAKDCFKKAQTLGYKGPQFFKQLNQMDPANSTLPKPGTGS